MQYLHITSWFKVSCLCFILIAGLAGCQKPEEVQLEASYPYNCSWYENHEIVEDSVSGPHRLRYVGEGNQLPAEFSYGPPLEVNPTTPDHVLVAKGIWDEVTQTIRSTIIMLDLQTLQETAILELESLDNPQTSQWGGIRWGQKGWIVAEKINDQQLYLISPNGGSPRRLTNPALGAYHNPCWVADGTEVLTLGYDVNGQGSRIRTVDLNGEVKHEYMLMDVSPDTFVRYHQFADWRADSLLVSAHPVGRHDLNIFTYPDMTLIKRIKVVDPSSRSAILHHEWWPRTERILWSIYGALYATDWQTEETEVIWEDCERLLQGFAVMPNGEQAVCLFGERVVREDLGGTQYSTHLYLLELSSGELTRIK